MIVNLVPILYRGNFNGLHHYNFGILGIKALLVEVRNVVADEKILQLLPLLWSQASSVGCNLSVKLLPNR